eukprot:9099723-Prorocentrum_lima.AAC.1
MSLLYAPYRSVGQVSDGRAFAFQKLGSTAFLSVSIGRHFLVYTAANLRLSICSERTSGDIEHLA